MVGNRRRKKALLDNMIIDEKTIREALEKGERVTLECKQARSEVPKELWNTYSAFANTVGGLILLGVEEHRKEADPARRFEVIDNNLKVVGMDGRNIVLPVKETVVMSNDKTEDNNRELSDVLKSVLKENLEKLTDRQIDMQSKLMTITKSTMKKLLLNHFMQSKNYKLNRFHTKRQLFTIIC